MHLVCQSAAGQASPVRSFERSLRCMGGTIPCRGRQMEEGKANARCEIDSTEACMDFPQQSFLVKGRPGTATGASLRKQRPQGLGHVHTNVLAGLGSLWHCGAMNVPLSPLESACPKPLLGRGSELGRPQPHAIKAMLAPSGHHA